MAAQQQVVPRPRSRQVLGSLIHHGEQRSPQQSSPRPRFVRFASVQHGEEEEEEEEAHCLPLQLHASHRSQGSALCRGED